MISPTNYAASLPLPDRFLEASETPFYVVQKLRWKDFGSSEIVKCLVGSVYCTLNRELMLVGFVFSA